MQSFEVWDVIRVPFPYTARPILQRRPALVVSADGISGPTGLLWVLMITSAENRRWPGDVEISVLSDAGLPAPSLVRTAKIATIEATEADRLGSLPRRDRKEVTRHLAKALRQAFQPKAAHSRSARPARSLRIEELRLVEALIASSPGRDHLANNLEHRLVEEMNDGGMGSLRFVDDGQTDRSFGAAFAEGRFLDEDGVPVSVVLNLDDRGALFELDVFKADFSALKRFPAMADLQIVPPE